MEINIQAFVSGELIGSDLHLVSGTHTKEFTTILSHKIIQLEDEAIRKSLKELGWTPPEAHPNEGECVYNSVEVYCKDGSRHTYTSNNGVALHMGTYVVEVKVGGMPLSFNVKDLDGITVDYK